MKARGLLAPVFVLVSLAVAVGGCIVVPEVAEEPAAAAEPSTEGIYWLIHSAFRIERDGLVVYVDPIMITEGETADVILITHDHGDHCAPDAVAGIQGAETVIVTTEACAANLSGTIEVVAPGDTLEVKGIPIEAVFAYNIDKFRSEGVPYHPRGVGVGFIFTLGGQRIYHAGDTDNILEMADIDVDIAMLPVSGLPYVMTVDEAAAALGVLKTRLAIPIHIGRSADQLVLAEEFAAKAPVPVAILQQEVPPTQ